VKWLVAVIVAAAALAAPRAARADDAVALLTLDADARLEIYGQPVASEVARALVAGGIDVVVVGPKMGVPARARLIVDGKIIGSKADTVVLSLRIRDRDSGTVLDNLTTDATALTSIDQAEADLSARVLPIVRARLAAIRAAKAAAAEPIHAPAPPSPHASAPTPLLVAVTASTPTGEPLRGPLGEATDAWLRARHREPRAVAPAGLAAGKAAATIDQQRATAGLALEILDYTIEPGKVPLARARVRVRLADATHVVFDRVVITDTIVGDRDQPLAQLAGRVAREVLAILAPNAAREMPELHAP